MKFLKDFRFRNKDSLTESEKLTAYRQSGDLGVLGSLYEPYMEMVFAICFKYLKNEDEAKDAVMQLFEKLVTDLRTHEVGHFKGWLHTVSRNYCLMQIRTKSAVMVINDQNGAGEILAVHLEDDLPDFAEENLASLEKCMESLVLEQQLSVQLFYMQDKCYKEIAVETGFELSKVKSYIQNGKRNLKICMDRNGSF